MEPSWIQESVPSAEPRPDNPPPDPRRTGISQALIFNKSLEIENTARVKVYLSFLIDLFQPAASELPPVQCLIFFNFTSLS